jgi:hypothetical protein
MELSPQVLIEIGCRADEKKMTGDDCYLALLDGFFFGGASFSGGTKFAGTTAAISFPCRVRKVTSPP